MIDDQHSTAEDWAPVSDLMAVLMLIFMFIAIINIGKLIVKEAESQKECNGIFRVLDQEFKDDFIVWDAKLDEDLTIRFSSPDVLFEIGSDTIRPYFKEVLSDFFPRYLQTISEYQKDVNEIRIEGHTSSEYRDLEPKAAYLKNMELSQSRTVKILSYVLSDTDISSDNYDWARDSITANGLSSSKLVDRNSELVKITGNDEDKDASRRVEFRLVATACQNKEFYKDA